RGEPAGRELRHRRLPRARGDTRLLRPPRRHGGGHVPPRPLRPHRPWPPRRHCAGVTTVLRRRAVRGPSPHSSSEWGERRGEGQRQAPEHAAAPHPNPLPAEERGEGMCASSAELSRSIAWRAVLVAVLLVIAATATLSVIWHRMEPLSLARADALSVTVLD